MIDETAWWFIITRFMFQTFIVYAGMLALVYITANILAKMYIHGMRYYRNLYGPVRNEARANARRMHRLENLQNSGKGRIAIPAQRKKNK